MCGMPSLRKEVCRSQEPSIEATASMTLIQETIMSRFYILPAGFPVHPWVAARDSSDSITDLEDRSTPATDEWSQQLRQQNWELWKIYVYGGVDQFHLSAYWLRHEGGGVRWVHCDPSVSYYNPDTEELEPGCDWSGLITYYSPPMDGLGRVLREGGFSGPVSPEFRRHPIGHGCARCHECNVQSDEVYSQEISDDTQERSLCNDCLGGYGNCNWCDRLMNPLRSQDDVDGNPVCDPCASENSGSCAGCGGLVYMDNTICCDDCGDSYCEGSCYDDHQDFCNGDGEGGSEYSRHLREYGYKPIPVFHGTGPLYLGVELEVDRLRGVEAVASMDSTLQDMSDILSPLEATHGRLLYFKADGSVPNGFELVSDPATLDFHRTYMPWKELMKVAVRSGYRSHQTSTTGLHVHVSTAALGNSEAERDFTMSKLVFLMWRIWPELVVFTRRESSSLAQWASPNHMFVGPIGYCGCLDKQCQKCGKELMVDLQKPGRTSSSKVPSGRYAAVNPQPGTTIEFRLYRGTLRYSTFMATLEMTQLMVLLAGSLNMAQVSSMDWQSLIEYAADRDMTYLFEHLTNPERSRTIAQARLRIAKDTYAPTGDDGVSLHDRVAATQAIHEAFMLPGAQPVGQPLDTVDLPF